MFLYIGIFFFYLDEFEICIVLFCYVVYIDIIKN